MSISLRFGCPRCEAYLFETGEFEDDEVWVEDMQTPFRRFLRNLLGGRAPGHYERRKRAKKEPRYREKAIDIPLNCVGEEMASFVCPHCQARFTKVLLRDAKCIDWDWRAERSSYVVWYHIKDCGHCGGHLTRYQSLTSGFFSEHDDCRSCGAGSVDSDHLGQHNTWGPRW